eukprot:8995371-Pyramimonas_sp.AAC.1
MGATVERDAATLDCNIAACVNVERFAESHRKPIFGNEAILLEHVDGRYWIYVPLQIYDSPKGRWRVELISCAEG